MLGYLLLSFTIAVSAFALRFWLSFFRRRIRGLKNPVELADLPMQEADIVSSILPRRVRTVWNTFVLTAVFFCLGLPHWLVIGNFWRQQEADFWLYVHYAWTLAYWIAVVAAYAFVIARHRESRRRAGFSSEPSRE